MAGPPFAVKLDGVRRLVRQIAAVDAGLRRNLGKANKEIGARVIAKAVPRPVQSGRGAGAVPRPSASSTVLQIRAGGGWRDSHAEQWGPRFLPRFAPRPFIAGAAEQQMPEAERDYLDALAAAAASAGLRFVRH